MVFYTHAICFVFTHSFPCCLPPSPSSPFVCLLSVPNNLVFCFCATLSSLLPTFKRFHLLAPKIPIFPVILSRKTHAGGFRIPDFELCSRPQQTRQSRWYWSKNRHTAWWNKPEDLDRVPHSHPSFYKDPSMRTFTNSAGETGSLRVERWNQTLISHPTQKSALNESKALCYVTWEISHSERQILHVRCQTQIPAFKLLHVHLWECECV